jgi:hypothetical protein
MTHCPGLSGGVGRFLCGAVHLPCRSVGGECSLASLSPCDLAPRPSAGLFDRSARTVVSGLRFFEKVQHVLRTISGPHCKKMMICIL